ncbi:MAG: RsmE family RNA methyltransferase [Nitriliruptoraceae bacterium]
MGQHIPYVIVAAPLSKQPAGGKVELSSAERHHLGTVLRLRDGAELHLCDGRGAHAVGQFGQGHVVLTEAATVDPEPDPAVDVLQSVPKGRKFDDIVRVLTELGVDGITLLAASHTVGKVDALRSERMLERASAVVHAAAQQSRRSRLPRIDGPVTSTDVRVDPGTTLLVTQPGAPRLSTQLPDDVGVRVAVAVGPEGGWSAHELDHFAAVGGRLVGMGDSVLRTEHAAAAAVAVISAAIGRW